MIERYFSEPAILDKSSIFDLHVSQIYALTLVSFFKKLTLYANSTPIVAGVLSKMPLIYLIKKLDFPTPASPVKITIHYVITNISYSCKNDQSAECQHEICVIPLTACYQVLMA